MSSSARIDAHPRGWKKNCATHGPGWTLTSGGGVYSPLGGGGGGLGILKRGPRPFREGPWGGVHRNTKVYIAPSNSDWMAPRRITCCGWGDDGRGGRCVNHYSKNTKNMTTEDPGRENRNSGNTTKILLYKNPVVRINNIFKNMYGWDDVCGC